MEIIPQKISAVDPTMAIENSKIGCLFPILAVLRFNDIQDNGDTIFVIFAYGALVGGCSICFNEPI